MNIILVTPHQITPEEMDPGHTTAEAVYHATQVSQTAATTPFEYVALKTPVFAAIFHKPLVMFCFTFNWWSLKFDPIGELPV